MVRFSCFYSNSSSSRSKRAPFKSKSLGSFFRKGQPCDNSKTLPHSAVADRSCKSEEFNAESEIFGKTSLQQGPPLRKSHSMESGLCDNRQGSSSNDEIDNEFSTGNIVSDVFDGAVDMNGNAVSTTSLDNRDQASDTVVNNEYILTIDDPHSEKVSPLRKSHSMGSALCDDPQVSSSTDEIDNGCSPENFVSDLFVGQMDINTKRGGPSSDTVINNEYIFTIGDPLHSEKGSPDYSDTGYSGEVFESCYEDTRTTKNMINSSSLPEIGMSTVSYAEFLSGRLEDLYNMGPLQNDFSSQHHEEIPDKKVCSPEISTCVDSFNDVCINSDSPKDWEALELEEVKSADHVLEESINEEETSKSFKIMRITEWVNDLPQFDAQETRSDSQPEMCENLSISHDELLSSKADDRVSSIDAAKAYISFLNPSATTAQLSNLGLTVIPIFAAFVSLKVLNLSGNSIAKITAGSLPRGLHYLNLSRNNISVIEGLRDLTRLRILNLSCNRILRIGHGLGSCSSIKELYLAGNKISEVDGLHRLLKLTVLDLRFNKISSPKSLDQLAANYNTLQVIGVEGNPVQKNVGDEPLRKYLLGLLPHLVYINRQAIKSNAFKDTSDRSVKRGLVSHQLDRGLRSDIKHQRKASRSASSSRASSSLIHAQKIRAASPKASLPRSYHRSHIANEASSSTSHRRSHSTSRSGLAIRRSQSEGALNSS